MTEVLRLTAFSTDPAGGNPAGVVPDAAGLDEAEMRRIAAEVGYSETAFVTARAADGTLTVRYFSPESEVPFCGHATIATGVALAEREGAEALVLDTAGGRIGLSMRRDADGVLATLVSAPPRVDEVTAGDVDEVLGALGWPADALDPSLPARWAFAGARHLVLGVATRERLGALDYDFDRLRALLEARDAVTLALVHRRDGGSGDGLTFDVRNPFPTGGVVEDPATGAAAAAFGGYLRLLGIVSPPVRLTLHQGEDMGRPSLLLVDVPAGDGGIAVSGHAVAIGA